MRALLALKPRRILVVAGLLAGSLSGCGTEGSGPDPGAVPARADYGADVMSIRFVLHEPRTLTVFSTRRVCFAGLMATAYPMPEAPGAIQVQMTDDPHVGCQTGIGRVDRLQLPDGIDADEVRQVAVTSPLWFFPVYHVYRVGPGQPSLDEQMRRRSPWERPGAGPRKAADPTK